jgi:CRP-like cAMP-binding protein
MVDDMQPARVLRNQLLSALPAIEQRRILPVLQPTIFSTGQIISEPGQRAAYGYFPTGSLVALLYTTQDGATVEMGLIGNDGVIGTAIFLGGESTVSRAIVALGGSALKVPAQVLSREFACAGPLQRLLLLYTQAFLTQVSQTAVCNRLHAIEQRLCRWLLLCQDRTNSAELRLTQELIGNMLGGRRESVTVAAGRLQDAGLIHYCRGQIRILDRLGLESNACECYRVVADELNRLFGRKRTCELSQPGLALREAV